MQIIILAGGSGTRFWPLSRRQRPKQLVALEGDRTLLQSTCDRLEGLIDPQAIWVCTNTELVDEVARQLPALPRRQILAEPSGRNTTAAIGWSLISMPPTLRDEVVAVLPADHRVLDGNEFRTVLAAAGQAAEVHDGVVALGVRPRRPDTGYGYLEMGEPIDGAGGLKSVERFREKPDAATAESFLAAGNFLWNAGIFVFRGSSMLRWIDRFEPEIGQCLRRIEATPERLAEIYPTIPSISIDYAVMERLEGLTALPLDCGWSDLGSWEAFDEILPADEAGNSQRGDVVAIDCRNSLLWSECGTVAAIGVSDLVVVRTGDAVLVMPRERSQEVRRIVDELRARDRDDLV